MNNILKNLIQRILPIGSDNIFSESQERNERIKNAVAICLIYMAKVDNDYSPAEKEKIIALIADNFLLKEKDSIELVAEAEKSIDSEPNFETLVEYISNSFHYDEKYELIRDLWILMLADEHLHAKEEELFQFIIKKIKIDKNSVEEVRREVENERAH